jgi:hypothetical protein
MGTFEDFRACIGKLIELLTQHHQDEQTLLFERIRNYQQLREGGPFCSYFFDFFLMQNPRTRAEKLIRQVQAQSVVLAPSLELDSYFRENSPLCIPLEEHIAIHSLAREMDSQCKDSQSQDKSWIAKALSTLRDLLQVNFQKEESCLYEVVKGIKDAKLHEDLCRILDEPLDPNSL